MSNLVEHGFAWCHATRIYRSRIGRCTVRWNTSRTYLELHASSAPEEVGKGSAGEEQDLRAERGPAFGSTRPTLMCSWNVQVPKNQSTARLSDWPSSATK